MEGIKHLLYESGVYEVFKLVVEDSQFAGTYVIEKPDGWDEVNSIIYIDDEYFNVNNFIIGESNKIKFLQYVENSGYDIIEKVYAEKGGDGRILFKWLAVKDGIETDLLEDGFELNLNKYDNGYEKSMLRIETEIKKRESHSKLLNREDISINLFSEKDLDNLPISPIETDEIYFKEGGRKKTNFYFFSTNQVNTTLGRVNNFFFLMTRGEDFQLGDNTNNQSGYVKSSGSMPKRYYGPLISTKSTLKNIQIEISNMSVFATKQDSTFPKIKLYYLKKNGASIVEEKPIVNTSSDVIAGGDKGGQIKIVNETFDVGNLKENESLELVFKTDDNSDVYFVNQDSSLTVEVHSNLATPMRKASVLRLNKALDRICKLYTNGSISLESNLLNIGGFYYNSAISTGLFLRGIYTENILTTSLKALLYDGVAPLLACGFDLLNDKLVIEDIEYFFKDVQAYDLTDKDYIEDAINITHDTDLAFNQLLFGGKKYSTGKTRDIYNGNTELEASTPLISIKKKFDKKTDLIIDEDKIQTIILDASSSSKTTDDDLVLIDLVDVANYVDESVLPDTIHVNENNKLVLYSYENPFDILPLNVGGYLTITSGLNAGTWQILLIDKAKIVLNKTTSIQEGTSETPITFTVSNITKNRASEGFGIVENVQDVKTAANLRHNPKYHLARWFPYYGGAFDKKNNTSEIIITEFKNNGKIKLLPNSDDLANELPGETIYNKNESLGRLRSYRNPFFNGQNIEITINEVDFSEFLELQYKWRFGINGDRNTSRGYISVPTQKGVFDIYPFGDKAIEHDRSLNELIIRGKVKNGSGVELVKPTLDLVEVINPDTIKLSWHLSNPIQGNLLLQVSKNNGVSWQTLRVVDTTKVDETITDSYFDSVLKDTELLFRIVLQSDYQPNTYSNRQNTLWTYNAFIYKETLLQENIDCGVTYLEFELIGTGTANINWNFTALPTGGSCKIIDNDNNTIIKQFSSPSGNYLDEYTDSYSSVININGTKKFRVELFTARGTDGKILSCIDLGNSDIYFMSASIGIDITDSTQYNFSKIAYCFSQMYSRRPDIQAEF